MALATLTDLTNRFSADIVLQWADDNGDGVADTAVVAQVLDEVTDYVESLLKPAYPDAVPFTAGNVPNVLKGLALWLAAYAFASRRQKAADEYVRLKEQADAVLAKLAEPGQCLVFPDTTVTYAEGSSQTEAASGAWSSYAENDSTMVFSEDTLTGF